MLIEINHNKVSIGNH